LHPNAGAALGAPGDVRGDVGQDRSLRSANPAPLSRPRRQSVNPRNELTAAWMPVVRDEPWAMSLNLIPGQTDRLWIEFSVVEKAELAEPFDFAVLSIAARPPIGHSHVNQPLASARVEDHRVEGVERCGMLRRTCVNSSLSLIHVQKRPLIDEPRSQLLKLHIRSFDRLGRAAAMGRDKQDATANQSACDNRGR